MRILPKVPYDTLQKLVTNKSISNKGIEYLLNLCKSANSNGLNKDKSVNSFLKRLFSMIGQKLSRSTGYRVIKHIIQEGLVHIEDGQLYIDDYKEAFEEGSNGMVDIPMFTFSGAFRSLTKLAKRLSLYFIGQIRDLQNNKTVYFNIEKNLATKLGVHSTHIGYALKELEQFFFIRHRHKGEVVHVSIHSHYLLPDEIDVEDMTKNISEDNEHKEKAVEIDNMIRTRNIIELLKDRAENLKDTVEKDEIDINRNRKTIINQLILYNRKDIKYVLDALADKLRHFSDPIMSLGAYVTSIKKEYLSDKTIIGENINWFEDDIEFLEILDLAF